MSKTTHESKDVFGVCKQNVDMYFCEVERLLPQYLQSIINLQQEYISSCMNIIESSISLQQEFANKAGINTNVSPAFIKLIDDATEEFIKIRIIQNKAILATIDATQQNVKMFNDNAKTFAELNENILQSWISASIPTRN